MNEQRFIKHVRQYGLLAQRTRKSYAEVVSELRTLRAAAIAQEVRDVTSREQAVKKMDDQLQREYGVFDANWSLTGSG